MTFLKHTFSLLAFLCSIFSFAQEISGKVLSDSKEPIPFATVQIGDGYGVITNEEGNFSINKTNFKETDSVKISCLGYEKLGMLVKDFSSSNYTLKEQVNELSEVYLTNRNLSVDSIMYYVNQNISKNYNTSQVDYNIFSRRTEFIQGKNIDFEIDKSTGFSRKQLKNINKDINTLETTLLNNRSKQYTDLIANLKIKDNNNSKLKIDKAVRFLDERNDQSLEKLAERGKDLVSNHLDKNKIYTVKSGWFKLSDSVSLKEQEQGNKMEDTINSVGLLKNLMLEKINNHAISKSSMLDFIYETRKYEYELADITFLDNEMVYIITFKPKRSSVDYEGTMYISNESFAVLRADYKFYKGRVGEKFNLRLLLGIKYVENGKNGAVMFKKAEDGYYYPRYISEHIDRYFYVNRPFKFIENDDRGNKFAFDFNVEGTFKEKTELLFISQKTLSNTEYESLKEVKKVDYKTEKRYSSEIWKDYDVIEPLQEMKSFDVEE
ncbi:carboxypeptidase-like regulatory domain-containing protein [Mangrovimonas cancribranchiae]|uniref:Carboxypeptidase-like regulatory domain-containing protein n=1 Tax=Mangrovimonas cancribranchiae TaxID=3080055 RepID=A0AAU6NZF6_9FLAO